MKTLRENLKKEFESKYVLSAEAISFVAIMVVLAITYGA
jgi:hypothetical protein